MNTQEIVSRIAGVIKQIADLAPGIIKTAKDAEPFAKSLYNILAKGHRVTEEELDQLEAKLSALSEQLQKPLPPEE